MSCRNNCLFSEIGFNFEEKIHLFLPQSSPILNSESRNQSRCGLKQFQTNRMFGFRILLWRSFLEQLKKNRYKNNYICFFLHIFLARLFVDKKGVRCLNQKIHAPFMSNKTERLKSAPDSRLQKRKFCAISQCQKT